jgi:hypothetical protein
MPAGTDYYKCVLLQQIGQLAIHLCFIKVKLSPKGTGITKNQYVYRNGSGTISGQHNVINKMQNISVIV